MKTRGVLDSIHTKELDNLHIFIICSKTRYYIFRSKTMFLKIMIFFFLSFISFSAREAVISYAGEWEGWTILLIFSSSQIVEKMT